MIAILRYRFAYLLLPLLHLVGIILYLDLQEVWHNPPVVDTDYAAHWAAVWSAAHFLEDGHLWGYDPSFMAGHPEGTLFNVDNKLIEAASWALSKSGLRLPLAYNLVLLSLLFLAPLALYPAALWLKLGRWEALLTQAAGLGLWYLDPVLRWAWQGGTLAFAATVCLSALVLAAAARLSEPGPSTPLAPYLVWFVLGPLLFWLHAMTFVLLCLPLAVLAIRRWPVLRWARRMPLLLWPPLVVLANLPWLLPTISFLWALRPSNQYLQGGLPALAADLLGVGYVDGAATVSLLGLRWLVLLFGGWGLWRMARDDAGGQAVTAGAGLGFLLAYGAVHVPGGGSMQPYRYIEQAMLWATIGIGPGLQRLLAIRRPVSLPGQRTGLAVMAVGLPALWVGYAVWQLRPPSLGGPAYHRWQGPAAEVKALCAHLQSLPLTRGRVLTDDFRVGALLPWCSGAQVIGGPFGEVWTAYGYSNSTIREAFGRPYRQYNEAAWREVMASYKVRWLVVYREWNIPGWYALADWLADHPAEVSAGPQFGRYYLFNVRGEELAPSYAVTATPGRLVVTHAPPQPFTLPFHWLPYLRAEPEGVLVGREQVGDDPIPFLRVDPGSQQTFTICTDYGWRSTAHHACP